jgi:hypothetical protein
MICKLMKVCLVDHVGGGRAKQLRSRGNSPGPEIYENLLKLPRFWEEEMGTSRNTHLSDIVGPSLAHSLNGSAAPKLHS